MSGTCAVDVFLERVKERTIDFYGDRLVSLAVFGSHASGGARPRSDIDLLVILAAAPSRRGQRLDEFDRLEEGLEDAAQALEASGHAADLSPVIRTREEAERFSVLYLDMTVAVRILFDRDGFLAARLARLAADLRRLGAERRSFGARWYWILKRDFRPGEVFEIP